jgi:hypothetical protein
VTTANGSFVLVKFVPGATSAEITRFLELHRLAIVDGPRAEGVFRVRVATNVLSRDEVARVAARMRENSAVVGFVAAAE